MSEARDQRYPPEHFVRDIAALLEAASTLSLVNLREWLEEYYQEYYPDIPNEPERGQLLLNALGYYETNRVELDREGAIVLGESRSLYPPELLGALYAVVMAAPVSAVSIAVPVRDFVTLMQRQKDAWEKDSQDGLSR